jgi:hypothetical protein
VRACVPAYIQYVDTCPYLEKNVLLSVVPYEILHAAYVDIGLGRLRGGDEGQTAAAAVASADAAVASSTVEAATAEGTES